jgi:hypothetical protein
MTDFICYLHPGWKSDIRPASSRRDWMDSTPNKYATRCLPMVIANSYGWNIHTPIGFTASWTGGPNPNDVTIRPDDGTPPNLAPVAIFGAATMTIHVHGIFRTPPGWDLWAGPIPNSGKDGIYALSGIIETDWSVYTWTINWQFTRPNHWVRFEPGEPIVCIHPVQRGVLEQFEPRFAPMSDDPDLLRQFNAWTVSRNAFQTAIKPTIADSWQKKYYTGDDMDGNRAEGHVVKMRLKPFKEG